jgi:ferrochelatase
LLFHTKDQANALRVKLKQTYGDNIVVNFAMRYGSPSVDSVIDEMLQQGVRKLLVLPLYPQYCASTTASTFDAVAASLAKKRLIPELRFINHYHDFPQYVQAVADKIRQHWAINGRADKLIFTYHGIPKRYLLNGDPYHCECYKTSRLLAENLGLNEKEYLVTFQSRFGREEWLQPYTDKTLIALPEQGVKSVQLVCPGFSSDCLETIEEIDVENRDYFMKAGGSRYEYIKALNAESSHIDMMEKLLEQHLHGWTVFNDTDKRVELANKLGAEN